MRYLLRMHVTITRQWRSTLQTLRYLTSVGIFIVLFLSVFQSAVEEVNRRNVQSMVSQMPIDPVNPILVIVVKRENIVDHTLNQIMKCGPYDLKKPLKVIGSFSNLAINLNDKNNLLTMHARVRDKTRKDWMRLPVFKSLDLRAPTSLLLDMVLLKMWMILRTKVVCCIGHFEVVGYDDSVMWHNFCIKWFTFL